METAIDAQRTSAAAAAADRLEADEAKLEAERLQTGGGTRRPGGRTNAVREADRVDPDVTDEDPSPGDGEIGRDRDVDLERRREADVDADRGDDDTVAR